MNAKQDWLGIKLYRKKVSILLFITTLIASVIMYSFSELIADLVGANPVYVRMNSFFILPMAFFILNYQSLRGLKRISEFSFFYWMSRIFASAIIILIAVQFSNDENIPIYAFLLAIVLVSVLSYFVFLRSLSSEIKSSENLDNTNKKIHYKEIFVLSLPLLLAQSGQFVMGWTDKLMIGGFWNAANVGVYDVSAKFSMFVNIALTSIASITSPKFAETFSLGDMDRLKKIVLQSTKISFWSTLPLFIGFVLIAPFMLNMFGDDFVNGFYVLCVLSFARLVSALTGPAGTLLQMTGRQIIFMKVLFMGAIINIVANYLLIPIYGILGAAISTGFSIVFWNLIMVYYVYREFGFLTIYIPFLSKIKKSI